MIGHQKHLAKGCMISVHEKQEQRAGLLHFFSSLILPLYSLQYSYLSLSVTVQYLHSYPCLFYLPSSLISFSFFIPLKTNPPVTALPARRG